MKTITEINELIARIMGVSQRSIFNFLEDGLISSSSLRACDTGQIVPLASIDTISYRLTPPLTNVSDSNTSDSE